MPLSGSSKFVRTQVGDMSFDEVNYVEFHADTWDFGYTLWLDGVQFEDCSPMSTNQLEGWKETASKLYPNPVDDVAVLDFEHEHLGDIMISVHDIEGREVLSQKYNVQSIGCQQVGLNLSLLPKGIYSYRIFAKTILDQRIFIKN